MSAYKEFSEIQFANASILVQALKEMGYKPEAGQSLTLHGYRGDARQEQAQIVVRRQQLGQSSNDLGFAWNGKAFIPIISEYDARHVLTAEWRQQLQATYSKLAVLQFLQAKGANVRGIAVNAQGDTIIRASVEVSL